MAQRVRRWIEVTPSQFTHEAEGINLVRSLLPANAPFRAWSNFEFRDGHGKWHEVDLLVLGRRRLHLAELKYYSGTLRGDDLTWRRDGHRAEDSPLKLARRKAQRLASKLQDELIGFDDVDESLPRRRRNSSICSASTASTASFACAASSCASLAASCAAATSS